MNRRGFFKTLAAATAGFTILPPVTTYQRVWKATRQINPEWINAPYEIEFRGLDYAGTWRWLDQDGNPIMIPQLPFPHGAGETRREVYKFLGTDQTIRISHLTH